MKSSIGGPARPVVSCPTRFPHPRGDASGNDHGFCIPSNYTGSIPHCVSSFRVLVSTREPIRGAHCPSACRTLPARSISTCRIFIFLFSQVNEIQKTDDQLSKSFCKVSLGLTWRYARVFLVSVSADRSLARIKGVTHSINDLPGGIAAIAWTLVDGSVVGRDRAVEMVSRCPVLAGCVTYRAVRSAATSRYPALDNITNAICTVARLESEQLTSNVDRDIVAHCPEQL